MAPRRNNSNATREPIETDHETCTRRSGTKKLPMEQRGAFSGAKGAHFAAEARIAEAMETLGDPRFGLGGARTRDIFGGRVTLRAMSSLRIASPHLLLSPLSFSRSLPSYSDARGDGEEAALPLFLLSGALLVHTLD